MRKSELFHPRIFNDRKWAEGYYKRNVKSIQKIGKRYAGLLKDSGFHSGRILDAGCGFGTVAIELAAEFPNSEITGIDLGEPLLELAQTLAEQAGASKQITFLKGDVQEIEFQDDSFDVVISTFMVHIVEKPIRMLNEIERVAKPDGRVMVSDLRRSWLGVVEKKLGTAFTIEEAKKIIEQSELRTGKYSKGLYWWDYLAGV